jgi:hypothetical protein
MDSLKKIRDRLEELPTSEEERPRLLELFECACEGLASQTTRGIKEAVEERLEAILEELEEKAIVIERRIKA